MESETIQEQEVDNSGETVEESSEVDLGSVSDSDLNAYLSEALKNESDDGNSVESNTEQSTENQQTQVTQETKQQPQQQEMTLEQQLEAEKKRSQDYEQQLAQVRHFTERRRDEIAYLKGELIKKNKMLKEQLPNLQVEDPDKWLEGQLELRNNEKQVEQLASEEEGLLVRYQTQQAAASYLKPHEMDMDAITACLRRDNVDPDYIQRLQKDPYGTAAGDTFIHLAKRAYTEKALLGVWSAYQDLQLKHAELEKKFQSKGGDIMRKIEQVAKTKTPITAKNGAAPDRGMPVDFDVSKLTDEQLKEALSRAT